MQLIEKKSRVVINPPNDRETIDRLNNIESEENTLEFGNFGTAILESLIIQIQDMNKLNKSYKYDPHASVKAGLPKYTDYLIGKKNIIE